MRRAAFEDDDEDEVEEGPKGPQRGTYPRDFGHQRTRTEAGREAPPGIRCASRFVCAIRVAPMISKPLAQTHFFLKRMGVIPHAFSSSINNVMMR